MPVRIGTMCGAKLMFSIPPATTTSASPMAMACAAMLMDFMPEEHTLFIVVQGTTSGIPAIKAACRAGACPTPACNTLPIMTSSTSEV